MGKHYSGKNVFCPYYKQEDKLKIYCEGVAPDTTTHIVFPSKEMLNKWRSENCEKASSSCALCIGLNAKWGYENGRK